MSDKKIKVLTLSDHPHMPSGVATQTKYVIEALLATNKFEVYSLGGAIKHNNYDINKVNENWTVEPVDGYGNQQKIRELLKTFRPDMIWFMTDPRFYGWLWEMENEIRSLCPLVYYHVWDNFPYPTFNKVWYDSTDTVVTISKVTSNIVQTVSPEVDEHYLPHAIPTDVFKKLPTLDVKHYRTNNLEIDDDTFLLFWNNRNARRKQSGSLIYWFNDFLNKIKKTNKDAKAVLLMHTEPNDPNGQDLYAIINSLGLNNGEVRISTVKVDLPNLAMIYNSADATIGISDAEGFGLATFESLACETPIITTMTGGLQEQVTKIDRVSESIMLKRNNKAKKVVEYEHGIGIEPASKAIIGSQEVPFIYEDRLSGKDVTNALVKMYEYGPEKRDELGNAGRSHVLNNYNFENFSKKWEEILSTTYERCGSWENRKDYTSWEMRVV